VVVNTGTRDEQNKEAGIAHFIEHLIFKGTRKRNTYQVLSYLENVGGELNAYTTKEETFFYASVLNKYFARSLEILSDIIFHSCFHPKDIETEKEVVKEEIKLCRDTPSELIFDEFENLVFQHHPLGTNILGTPASINAMTQEKINAFMQRTYNTDQMVIVVVGKVNFASCIRCVEKYFADIPANRRSFHRLPFTDFAVRHKKIKQHSNQANAIIGQALPCYDERKNQIAILLNNILGGQGLNSRLNMAIREKKGYVYTIESNYAALSDAGLFSIYTGSDPKNREKCFELVFKEMKKLREQALGTLQLHRAHSQLIGQLCISFDSNLTEMLSIGKNYLMFDTVDEINTIIAKIRTITSSDLMELANEMLNEETMSTIILAKEVH
jgi:predicted Zn-dependent peptidase